MNFVRRREYKMEEGKEGYSALGHFRYICILVHNAFFGT